MRSAAPGAGCGPAAGPARVESGEEGTQDKAKTAQTLQDQHIDHPAKALHLRVGVLPGVAALPPVAILLGCISIGGHLAGTHRDKASQP